MIKLKPTTASIDAARSFVHRRGFSLLGRIVQVGQDDAFMPFLAEANETLTVVIPRELPRIRRLLDRFELPNVDIIVSSSPIAVPFDKGEVDRVWVHGDALHRNHRRALLLEIARCLGPGWLGPPSSLPDSLAAVSALRKGPSRQWLSDGGRSSIVPIERGT